jgi:hypothetical protein
MALILYNIFHLCNIKKVTVLMILLTLMKFSLQATLVLSVCVCEGPIGIWEWDTPTITV